MANSAKITKEEEIDLELNCDRFEIYRGRKVYFFPFGRVWVALSGKIVLNPYDNRKGKEGYKEFENMKEFADYAAGTSVSILDAVIGFFK